MLRFQFNDEITARINSAVKITKLPIGAINIHFFFGDVVLTTPIYTFFQLLATMKLTQFET